MNAQKLFDFDGNLNNETYDKWLLENRKSTFKKRLQSFSRRKVANIKSLSLYSPEFYHQMEVIFDSVSFPEIFFKGLSSAPKHHTKRNYTSKVHVCCHYTYTYRISSNNRRGRLFIFPHRKGATIT